MVQALQRRVSTLTRRVLTIRTTLRRWQPGDRRMLRPGTDGVPGGPTGSRRPDGFVGLAPGTARAGPRYRTGSFRPGVAPVSRGEGPSLLRRHQPAAATIAALSVHMERLGRNGWSPSSMQ